MSHAILSPSGERLNGRAPRTNLAKLMRRRQVRGSYDAARDDDLVLQQHFAHADRLDADSAHSPQVRGKLVSRSRYEHGNNGYVTGVTRDYARDVVGLGPQLRVETPSKVFNKLLAAAWWRWSRSIQLRRKLNCMALAKTRDGESFARVVNNPANRDAIKLDVRLYETEQVASPQLAFFRDGEIDGLRLDQFGNPAVYSILRQHPGGLKWLPMADAELVPADQIAHWFSLERPGQHRAVPERASTLNLGASSRRWREATVQAAETAASLAALLEVQQSPDAPASTIAEDWTSVEINHRSAMALPPGVKATQMKSEHPNTVYDVFHRSTVSEEARPIGMPANRALGDSSKSNFSSAKLDRLGYHQGIDVDRDDAEVCVLELIFNWWFQEAKIVELGLGREIDLPTVPHSWVWPAHVVADQESQAKADTTKLSYGLTTLSKLYSDQGLDLDDEIEVMARDYGISVAEMRSTLLVKVFGPAPAPTEPTEEAPRTEPDEDDGSSDESSEDEEQTD